MIGSSGSFSNIQVLLTANNANLKSVLTQSSAGIRAFDKTVDRSNANLSKTGNLLGKTLAGGAMVAAAGLAYAVTKTVEFDKAMRNVNSLAGLGGKDFLALESRIVSLSTKLPQSATVLAEGLYDIQSSGFKGAAAMKVLEASALSASAGLTTTEVSARAISAVLNAYGLQARDAADVSDTLFQTVNAGVITFDELAGNLGDVVGGAAAAKVEIDEVGSAIAAMTLAGIGGAEATTSLNALLQKLIQPSKALTELYGELGYESGASALEADGLRGVMEKLRTATGGNITTLLQLFPEIRAARGALALMANEGENYARTAEQIEDKNNRAGAAQRVFNEQMKAASSQFTLLKNQADAVAIEVGLKLLPAMISVIDGTRAAGEGVGDLASLLAGEFGPGVADLVAIMGDLWNVFSDVGAVVWDLVEPLSKLGVGLVADSFNLLAAAIEPVTSFMSENEAVVLVLAAALGVHLAGGAAAAAAKLGWLAALSLVNLLTGLVRVDEQARKAVASLKNMAGGLIATGVISAGAMAWQNYARAVDDVKEAYRDAFAAMKKGDLSEASRQVEILGEKKSRLDELYADNASMTSFADALADVISIGKNAELVGLLDENTAQRFYDASNALNDMRHDALDLMAATEGLTFDQFTELSADLAGDNGLDKQAEAVSRLDSAYGNLIPRLEAAGISIDDLKEGEDFGNGWGMVQKYGDAIAQVDWKSKDAAKAQDDVVQAMGQVASAMGDAEKAADALEEALDSLTGSAMGVDEAGIEWRQGLHDLTKELKDSEAGITGNSLAAGKNRLAIQGQIEKMQDLLVAQRRNGAGGEKLTKTLYASRAALIASGKAAGIPRDAMVALLKQYKLTPALIRTLIKEHGGENVKEMLRDIAQDAEKVDKKKPKIKPESDPDPALRGLDKLLKFAGKVDEKAVEIPASAPGAESATRSLDELWNAALRADGTVATVTTVYRTVRTASKQADGGFYPEAFADGGVMQVQGTLPAQAKIAPGYGRGLVQWAEGETGGEAFIPLGRSKRARSERILGSVAQQFGYELAHVKSFANGGTTNDGWQDAPSPAAGPAANAGAGGGFPAFSFDYRDFNYKPFKFRDRHKNETAQAYQRAKAQARREYEREKARAKKEYLAARTDARFQRFQEWKERKALFQVANGQGEGRYVPVQGDAAASLADYDRAREAQAQARAELAARRSKNPYDTAADFYKAPTISIREYVKALEGANKVTKSWGQDMSRISQVAGADVAASLKAMGADGEKYVKQLANASVSDMKAMAAELRNIQMSTFQNGLAQDIAAQSQFQMNLGVLIKAGHADLAAQFSEMGYAEAGGLAAASVSMSPSQLSAMTGQMAQQDAYNNGTTAAAIQLAGLLQSSSRVLGVIGLSNASGKSISDVLGLLETHKDVFAKMPAGRMAQIRADQALLASGKQPSGLEYGGIVQGSQTSDSLYYRWAEKGSGGESLIPHAQDRRQRALAIWEQTGRILGATSGSGGGGSMVVIQPGAVTVSVDASGQNMSEAQVRQIANSTTDKAMAGLAAQLNSGTR